MLTAQLADADPIVMAVYGALARFACSEEEKLNALSCAIEIWCCFHAIRNELERAGEVAVTPTGMVRLNRLAR